MKYAQYASKSTSRYFISLVLRRTSIPGIEQNNEHLYEDYFYRQSSQKVGFV